MSYITGAQSVAKGDREEVFFDKGAFIFATTFADPYFSNDLVWKKIALHYKDESSQPGLGLVPFIAQTWVLAQGSNGGLKTVATVTSEDPENANIIFGDHYLWSGHTGTVQAVSHFAGITTITLEQADAVSGSGYIGFSKEVVIPGSTTSQRQVIILKDDSARGWFAPTSTSRSGQWSLEKIQIFDRDEDFFAVERANMPSPENFDITLSKRVAPSSTATSFEVPANLNSDSDFSVATIEDAGWTKTVDAGSDAIVDLVGSTGLTSRDPVSGGVYSAGSSYVRIEESNLKILIKWSGVNILIDAVDGSLPYTHTDGYTYDKENFNNNSAGYDFYEIFRGIAAPGGGSVRLQTDAAALASIKIEKIFSLEANERYNVKYTITEKNAGEISVGVPGTINDISVKALNGSLEVIEQAIHSVATGVEESFTFTANGATTLAIGTSGQAGYWKVDDVTLQKSQDGCTIPPAETQHYQVGFKVQLWDTVANGLLTSDIYTIDSIVGDKVTFDQSIVGSVDGKTLILKFPNYDFCNAIQKGVYQFVGKGY
jgi:hypothetical protein